MITDDPFGTVPDRDTDAFGTVDGLSRTSGDAEKRALVPRDQWDRYLMHHQDGTKPAANKGMTRVSTTKSSLSNTIGIQNWSGRRIAEGLAANEAVVIAAMKARAMPEGPARERALGKVAEAAFVVGGGKERAGLGTEMHEVTEAINRGELTIEQADERLQADLKAYYQMLADNDVVILPQFLERQVLCPYNNAGTFDNIVRMWNPDTCEYELLIADLKTGRKLDLGWLEIIIQLWFYANAYALWTTTKVIYSTEQGKTDKVVDLEGYYEPMPAELRTDKVAVFHVPLDGTATLITIDISGAERAVRAAVEGKRWNAEAKRRVTVVNRVAPPPFVSQDGFTLAPPVEQMVTSVGASATPDGPLIHAVWDSTPHPGGSVTEETNPYGLDPHAYPTKDAFTAALKAEERKAALAAAPAPAAAPVVERDPVTGRKKRTCGHCHRPGHTQKNCPDNPASSKYIDMEALTGANGRTMAEIVAPASAGDPEPDVIESATLTGVSEQGAPAMADIVLSPEGPPPGPYVGDRGSPHVPPCNGTSGWTEASGRWFCAGCGAPAAEPIVENAVGDVVTVAGQEFVKHSVWPATPPLSPTALILADIAAAPTSNDVLRIRDLAMAGGAWNPDLELAGSQRWAALHLNGL